MEKMNKDSKGDKNGAGKDTQTLQRVRSVELSSVSTKTGKKPLNLKQGMKNQMPSHLWLDILWRINWLCF